MKIFTSVAIALGALAFSSAHAASFNCAKARSFSEKTVCADADLSKADDEYAKLVASTRAVISDKSSFNRALIVAWKKREQSCTTRECVDEWYKTQINWTERIAKNRNYAVTEQESTPGLEKQRQQEIQQKEFTEKNSKMNEDKRRFEFINSLKLKYSKNIIPHSTQAYEVVSGFNINCRTPDKRVLPLMHALLASARSFESSDGEIKFHLQNRGSNVRIFGEALKNGKQLGSPSLYYEINEWRELRPIAIRAEALLNACMGFQGPIWLMPGEPGY